MKVASLGLAMLLSACSFRVEGVDVEVTPDLQVSDLSELGVDFSRSGIDAALVCDPDGGGNHCSTDGQSLLECRGDGSGYQLLSCAHGCGVVVGGAGCLDLEPSGVAQAVDYKTASAAPTITSDVVFHTDDGSITGGLSRPPGVGIKNGIYYRQAVQGTSLVGVGIFGFGGLTLSSGVVVRARGSSAISIVSSGDVVIGGTFDLQDDCATMVAAGGGAGGSAGGGGGSGAGQAGSGSGGGKSSGGGGAGHGDVGGGGGTTMVNGGSAGLPFGDLAMEPLVLEGGGGGGAGGSGGAGGNGGGAIQIAVDGTLTIKGVIHAGGCGGLAGGAAGSGGGGGAGGTILLEAANLVLAAGSVLAANGGGGGAGGGGSSGSNATASAMAAAGGSPGAAGGSGGAKGSTSGKTAPPGVKVGGGGGGAAGRIAIKTQQGTVDDQGAIWSPSLADASAAGQPPVLVRQAVFQ